MTDSKHEGVRAVVDKVEDAVGGVVGMASALMASGSTAAFVEKARRGDLYEIEAARIAIERSRNPAIQMFAQEMIEDHTTSSHHLMSALRTNEVNAELPSGFDTRHSTMLDNLRKASDDRFDSTFIDQQKLAHKETLTLFEGYAASGDNPQIAAFARGTIPALQAHSGWASVISSNMP